MEKILITGGTGFIGKNLHPFLSQLNAEIIILSDRCSYESGFDNIYLSKCDLMDFNEVKKKLKEIKASHLLHMAWGMSPSDYNLVSNFDWLKGSMNLLEEFKKNNGRRVIITGSGVEYKWDYSCCIEGITPLSYDNLYASTKNILRDFAFAFCNSYNIEIAWPRIFFTYGPHEHQERLVSHIIVSLLQNQTANIRNGNIYRDYIYVKDVANIIVELIFNDFTGVLNIGAGLPTKLADVGGLIAEIIGRPDLLAINYPEAQLNRVVFSNNDKLTNDLKMNLNYDLKEGIKETITWWKENLNP